MAKIAFHERPDRRDMIPTEEIIDEIQRIDNEVDGIPTAGQIREMASMSYWTIQNRFGGVVEARKEAGIARHGGNLCRNHPEASESDYIEDLQNVASNVERPPSIGDMKTHSEYEVGSIISHFDGMPEAREAAGLKKHYNHLGDREQNRVEVVCQGCGVEENVCASRSENYTYCSTECMGQDMRKHSTERVRKELEGLARAHGQAPTVVEFRAETGIHHGSFEQRDDLDSFSTELRGMGFEPKSPKDLSDEELLQDLREVGQKLGRPPTEKDMKNHALLNDLSSYRNRWGSWYETLQAAGLDPANTQRVDISGEELIEEFKRVAEDLGRPPGYREITELSNFSAATYERAFGTFLEAKQRAGFDPLPKQNQPSGKDHYAWKGDIDRPYDSNWLEKREQALQRDRRKCVRCGKTSQEHLEECGKDLHVHHITPWDEFDSEEERNRLENLATLCAGCHKKIEVLPITPQFNAGSDSS